MVLKLDSTVVAGIINGDEMSMDKNYNLIMQIIHTQMDAETCMQPENLGGAQRDEFRRTKIKMR